LGQYGESRIGLNGSDSQSNDPSGFAALTGRDYVIVVDPTSAAVPFFEAATGDREATPPVDFGFDVYPLAKLRAANAHDVRAVLTLCRSSVSASNRQTEFSVEDGSPQ
jgi:hypothetical protein